MAEYCQDESCAICLDNLQYRKKTIHTTECGHRFHESCIEKIKKNEGELHCPCCRSVIQPLIKQQIENVKNEMKQTKKEIDAFPVVLRSTTKYYDSMIADLEESLKCAKNAKRTMLSEVNNACKYNKKMLIVQKEQLQELMLQNELRKQENMRYVQKGEENEDEGFVPMIEEPIIVQRIRIPRLRIVERL